MQKEWSEIVPSEHSEEYRDSLENIIDELAEMMGDIAGYAKVLASLGKYKEWSDKQPVGKELDFSMKMLQNAGDTNVDNLLHLYFAIHEVFETFLDEIY